MQAFGIGTHEFGLLVAAYSFSAALSGLFRRDVRDRFERKRLLLLMFALFAWRRWPAGWLPLRHTADRARLAGTFGGVMARWCRPSSAT